MSVTGAVMVPHPPVIIPAVGRGREKEIQKTIDEYDRAMELLASWKPETIVVTSPHSIMYADYFHISPGASASGDLSAFGAPQEAFDVRYDTDFVRLLTEEAEKNNIPAGTMGERDKNLDHGTMVPLWFLRKYYPEDNYKLVRIGLSGLPFSVHYKLGQCISKTAEIMGKRTAVIASGDLSHKLKEDGPYGFIKEGPEYDERIMEVMGKADFGELFNFSEDFCERAAECGHRSFVIMAGAFDGISVRPQRLSHEGTFGVGYGICTFEAAGTDNERHFLDKYEDELRSEAGSDAENEDPYVRLARKTVETYIKTGSKPDMPKGLPDEMYLRRAGVFVSIKEEGRLRGCIGTIAPVRESIAEEIVENAISAAVHDPRFAPVRPWELDKLIYSVDVLGKPEEISSMAELDVKRYGVIVSRGFKRGLLLPDLEGVDSVEEQVAIAKRKAGIPAYENDVKLQRFEVIRHH